jgi:glucan phosphoethanolaminetransferase (alkaline phosphatase superfamily)
LNGDDAEKSTGAAIGIRVAFLHWAACLGIFTLLVIAAFNFTSTIVTWLAVIQYFASGIYLNRRVLRNLIEWHPMHNTLSNVASAKTNFFLFWPLHYLLLFVRLGINRVL